MHHRPVDPSEDLFWNDVRHHLGEARDGFWMAHPDVRARINAAVSGDPACWPTQWLRRRFADRLPLRHALSVGCGTGGLERDLVQQGIASHVTGIDLARGPLDFARAAAGEAGMGAAITYLEVDAREHLRRSVELDGLFFHASLHHFDRLPELDEHFAVLERRDYGGNLVSLIYPNLRRPGTGPGAPTPEAFDDAVRFLLDCEIPLLRHPALARSRSFHTVLVARPRP